VDGGGEAERFDGRPKSLVRKACCFGCEAFCFGCEAFCFARQAFCSGREAFCFGREAFRCGRQDMFLVISPKSLSQALFWCEVRRRKPRRLNFEPRARGFLLRRRIF